MADVLGTFGIHSTPNCPCKKVQREMNRAGPDQVEQRIDHFVERMAASSSKWLGLSKTFTFQKPACKQLILYACKKVRKANHGTAA